MMVFLRLNGVAEMDGILKKRGDILKLDAGFWEVRNGSQGLFE